MLKSYSGCTCQFTAVFIRLVAIFSLGICSNWSSLFNVHWMKLISQRQKVFIKDEREALQKLCEINYVVSK